MTAPDPSQLSAVLSLSDPQQSIALPKHFEVNIDLIYPSDYHLDNEEMLDQLLHNSGIDQVPPFALVKQTTQNLPSKDPLFIHQRVSYQLEPQLPGKYGLTFYKISLHPNDSKVKKPIDVISPIIYVNVTLPKVPAINLEAEAAPLNGLAERVPVELAAEERQYLSQDQSAYNVELFKSREMPWHIAFGLFLLSLILLGTALLYNYLQKMKPRPQPLLKEDHLAEAVKLLNQLKSQPSLQSSTVRDFINHITTSLRNSFKIRYQISSSSLTTQEFLEEVRANQAMTQEQKIAIEEAMHLMDRIKFGEYKPSLEECANLVSFAKLYSSSDMILIE